MDLKKFVELVSPSDEFQRGQIFPRQNATECHAMLFLIELVSWRDEFHMELVSTSDEFHERLFTLLVSKQCFFAKLF